MHREDIQTAINACQSPQAAYDVAVWGALAGFGGPLIHSDPRYVEAIRDGLTWGRCERERFFEALTRGRDLRGLA